MGDDWTHLCTVGQQRIDPLDTLGIIPDRPSSRSSQTSRTRRSRTSRPATSRHGAWTLLAALAHNLPRWIQLIGLPGTTTGAARTLRRRLLQIPGRLTNHARGWTLHLPARWPWHDDYTAALKRIRALPAPA